MKVYDFTNIKSFYVFGDIHGEFKSFFNTVKKSLSYDKKKYVEEIHPLVEEEKLMEMEGIDNYALRGQNRWHIKSQNLFSYNNSVIIVCGDCGFGFNKLQYYIDIFNKYNNLFEETNTHIIFVRGNHDDPSYFSDEIINMSNIKTVPDYSVIKILNENILCVGGAISVDRIWRKQQEIRLNKYSTSKSKKLYWENEQIVKNENIFSELKENNITITNVVTHSSPSFVFPSTKDTALGWLKIDANLKDDLINERQTLNWLYGELKKEHNIKTWSYGHFHLQNREFIDNVAFLANDDNYVGVSPILIYDNFIEMEKIKKQEKKRRKKKNNSNDMFFTLPSGQNIERPTPIEVDGGILNDGMVDEIHNEIERIIFDGENNDGVLVEEAPF